MATEASEFEPWLIDKLKSLKTDEGVFGSYISGILQSEESVDEKKDALEGILSEIVERDISVHVNEIIDKWELCKPKEELPKPKDVDIQLTKLLESQSLATTSRREYTAEEKKIREAILSQYSQLSDNEEDQEKEEEPDCQDLVKNTNAIDVASAARERREQSRLEAQRKKERDKEDREKQKALKEEKKEKRKTQKGERKREITKMETDWMLEDTTTPKVRSLTSLDTGVRLTPSGAAYIGERNKCLNYFSKWNETDQVEFVEQLLVRMCHYQHGHINAYLKPMLQRDFISILPKKGLDHVAENILSYLDSSSLCAAELVCREWQRVISEGMLWKKLVERKVRTDSLWRGLAERRGWIMYLFKPKPGCQHPPHSFYRQLYPKIIQDIQCIEDNWRMGRHNLQRINCHSENSKGVYCLQYDDNKIVSGLRDNTIKIWDRKTLQCIKELQGHTGSVLCLQYDERAIISGSSDSTVRVWDVNTGAMLNTLIHHCEAVLHLRFCNGMMVTCSKDRSIAVWDMTSTTEIMLRRVLVGHRAAVNVVDFDEKYIVSASGDRTIKVWNTSSCEFVRTLNGHKRGIACLQYRDRLVVSGSSDNTIRLWDVECGQCIRVLEGHEELVRCIRFDNKRIVSGAYDGKIKVWDLRAALDVRTPHQDLCLRTLVQHTGRVFRLQFDEFQIVSSSHDDTILIWDFLNYGGASPSPAAPSPRRASPDLDRAFYD